MKRSILVLASALALLTAAVFAGEGKKDRKTADCATTCPTCCGGCCESAKTSAATDAGRQQESAKVATTPPADAAARKS